ncbi:hypothetical protein ISG29_02080 [Nocardioides sp. CBS4Y-1]|uniref:Uncharacterized protein n=2 Tax=Nocardioides acrostichi TaxID=2784339 RepID=A0A930UZJ5_9ACTN|nr:hypothetical protein [Nocardioides acrostichi]
MVAIVSSLLILVAAFAVDLGMQRVVRSDMQALADVVALDAARLLDGRTAGEVIDGDADHATLAGVVAASAARNSTTLGRVDGVTGTLVYLDTGAHGAAIPRRDATGALVAVPRGQIPDAVLVSASGTVDFAFASGDGSATRTALAEAVTSACFSVGSYAASVSPANATLFGNLLQPLLGNSVVTAVGYQGLASADVSLLDLLSAPSLGLGSVDDVLSAPQVSLGNLYLAAASALQKDGDTVSANLLNQAAVSAVAAATVDLGDLLGLTTANDAVLSTRVNVLDLLVGSAFLADGDHLVGIPNLQAGLSSVGVTNTDLSIIERPAVACADDEAQTAQVRLSSDAKLSLSVPIVKTGVIDLSLTGDDGKPNNEVAMHLAAELGGARARLDDVACDPDRFDATVTTDLTSLALTGRLRVSGSVKVDLTLAGVTLTGVNVPVSFAVDLSALTSSPAGATHAVSYAVPPQVYGTPISTGSSPALPYLSYVRDTASTTIGPVTVKILGINTVVPTDVLTAAVNPLLASALTAISGAVNPIVNPLVEKLNSTVGQLADGLGVTIAGADFQGLSAPQCNAPRLRG